jgi:hypothetical protein
MALRTTRPGPSVDRWRESVEMGLARPLILRGTIKKQEPTLAA